ncbi:hypothetical protein HYX19_01600 [Candidatus Woesearchaeota archaeon]|nr:hypothetical protein [Candidatus Woesearchaeota archaeon]
MEKLREELSRFNFNDGILPMVSFEPLENLESRILFVGSELGDLTSGTKAMIKFAHKIKENPLKKTKVDMIPVLDTQGYPDKRTVVGDEGFGRILHMDSSYSDKYANEQVRELCNVLDKGYDLAVLLSSFSDDQGALFNGYFVMPQVSTEEERGVKSIRLFNEKMHDIMGSVLSGLNRSNLPVLKTPSRYLGGGYALLAPGIVLSGIKEGEEIKEFKTRDGFLRACEYRNVPGIAAYAISSTLNRELNEKAVASHLVTIENIINFYEYSSRKNLK